MKAFVVSRYGPDGLEPAEIPSPSVGPHDVLVDVRAASINPLDKMVRNGEFKQLRKYKPPFPLGHDVSGVITESGSQVHNFQVGDEVYARPRDLRIGTFAELIAVDQADVALKPTSLTMDEAAAVPLVSLAAWQTLIDLAGRARSEGPAQRWRRRARLQAIQFAKHLGAYTATTARSSDAERLCDLGADEVIDYTAQDFTEVSPGTTSSSTPSVART